MDLRYLFKLLCLSILSIFAFLAACTAPAHYAPVQNGLYFANSQGLYRVKPGDTLYSIAWAFSQDYRDLATRNNIPAPYVVEVGQLLAVTPNAKVPSPPAIAAANPTTTNSVGSAPASNPNPVNLPTTSVPVAGKNNSTPSVPVSIPTQASNKIVSAWLWPAQGRVVQNYDPNDGYKGIDISGTLGSPVRATAAGQVVYSGNGLAGYGNLIILKHNNDYLSAYADNQTLLVTEGQFVKAGQKIATMGKSSSQQVILHFEIRKVGQPVDPMKYLPNQSN